MRLFDPVSKIVRSLFRKPLNTADVPPADIKPTATFDLINCPTMDVARRIQNLINENHGWTTSSALGAGEQRFFAIDMRPKFRGRGIWSNYQMDAPMINSVAEFVDEFMGGVIPIPPPLSDEENDKRREAVERFEREWLGRPLTLTPIYAEYT